MSLFKIKIVTPERSVVEIDALSATLPVIDGEVTILSDHEPYIGALKAGEVSIRQANGSTESLAVSGGFVEFDTNTLSILADTAERAEEIDIERAEAARARAEKLKREQISMGEEEYARVAAAIEKETARLKIARRHRGRAPLSVIEGEGS